MIEIEYYARVTCNLFSITIRFMVGAVSVAYCVLFQEKHQNIFKSSPFQVSQVMLPDYTSSRYTV